MDELDPLDASSNGNSIQEYHDDNDIHSALSNMLEEDIADSMEIPSNEVLDSETNSSTNDAKNTVSENPSKTDYSHIDAPFLSPAKAVFSQSEGTVEHMLDDGDVARVLTTLESAKKPKKAEEGDNDVFEVIEIEEDPLTTVNSSDALEVAQKTSESAAIDECEMARQQLDLLNKHSAPKGRPLKNAPMCRIRVELVDESGNVSSVLPTYKPSTQIDISDNLSVAAKSKSRQTVLSSAIISKKEVEKTVSEKTMINKPSTNTATVQQESNEFVKNMQNRLNKKFENSTPIRPPMKPDPACTGTIEIPKELILGNEEIHSTLLFNTSNSSNKSLQDIDLIAILEGNDEDENDSTIIMDKEKEKKLAMEQMLTLPYAPKTSRKKNETSKSAKSNSKPIKKNNKAKDNVNDLVSSLMSEWSESDNESKTDERKEEKPPVVKPKTAPAKVAAPLLNLQQKPAEVPATFKRSRIIKKKIIWDPDAPETAISYASFAQSAATKKLPTVQKKVIEPQPIKKPSEILLKKMEPKVTIVKLDDKMKEAATKKRVADTVSPVSLKRRKVSELDRLLGDEGAINMLNALKQENNNADMSDTESNTSGRDSVTKLRTAKLNISPPEIVTALVVRQKAKRPATPSKSVATASPIKKEPVKRKIKGAGSESWDYIYSHRGDDSLIIRRRSNSSYSSTTSPRRLSIDGAIPAQSKSNDKTSGKKTTKSKDQKTFEFAKPNARVNAEASSSNTHSILMDIRAKSNQVLNNANLASITSTGKPMRRTTRSRTISETDPPHPASHKRIFIKNEDEYEEIYVKRYQGYVHIVLAPFEGKLQNTFTIGVS